MPLRKSDFEIGKPLRWPVYDSNQKLLLQEGFVIQSQKQLDLLFENGLFRNPKWVRPRSASQIAAQREKEEAAKPATRAESFDLTSINLRVGDMLQLQLLSEPNGNRYSIRLMGYLEKRSLLVTAPVLNNSVILMREGQGVVLRCFSGKSAYAFNSSVLRVCNAPYPYLHLAYPAAVQGMEVRKSARIKTDIIGSVWRIGDESVKMPCMIEDLSFNGAALNSTAELGKVGETLKLYFRLSLHGEAMYVSPSVVIRAARAAPPAADGKSRTHYGIEFGEFELAERLMLQNYIYQQLIENK